MRSNSEHVQKILLAKGIELTEVVEMVTEGWEEKSEGMNQILYKRGFINLRNLQLYTKDDHTDDSDNIIDED